MRILYIGVHSHKGWGAEYWIAKAFHDIEIYYDLLDYRAEFKTLSNDQINKLIYFSYKLKLNFLNRSIYQIIAP